MAISGYTDFEEIRDEILRVINKKIRDGDLNNMEGFFLIDGFVDMTVQSSIGFIHTRGTPMPSVAFLNRKSGELRLFAVKSLLSKAFEQGQW